ncbi:MAG: ketol-acid reductoisomerase [bacterium]
MKPSLADSSSGINLRDLTIGIIGYGSQGRAQALNLRDSGITPLVSVRRGRSWDLAAGDGFSLLSIEDLSRRSDIVMVLVPDEIHGEICSQRIFPNLKKGGYVGFAAGFSVFSGLVRIPKDKKAFLVAPKGPGEILRKRYQQGGSLASLVASFNNDPEVLDLARQYAAAIGCGEVCIETTFADEAVADLFGEQCVLAGGMVELMKAAFRILVENGFDPRIAYIECISEVEYMASLIARVGLKALGSNISSTAWYGGYTRGRRLIDDRVRGKMKEILEEIVSGKFSREFEYMGKPKLTDAEISELDLTESARQALKRRERR